MASLGAPSSTGLAHDEHTSVLEDRVNALENDVHFTQMGAIEAITRRMNRLARQQRSSRPLRGISMCHLQARKL